MALDEMGAMDAAVKDMKKSWEGVLHWNGLVPHDILSSTVLMIQNKRSRASDALKSYLLPHAGNNYHPHAVQKSRLILYGSVLTALKLGVFLFAVLLPFEAFLATDVLTAQAERIVRLTNVARQAKGVTELKIVPKLELSAEAKAEDMAQRQYFAHKNPHGDSLADVLNRVHYDYAAAAENLAVGFVDATEIVTAWKQSAEHYANMTDPDFTEVGVGLRAGILDGEQTIFVAEHLAAPFARQQDGAQHARAGTRPTQRALAHAAAPAKTSTLSEKPSKRTQESVTGTAVGTMERGATQPQSAGEVPLQSSGLLKEDQGPIVHTSFPQRAWKKYMQAKTWFSIVPSVFSAMQLILTACIALFGVILIGIISARAHRRHPHLLWQTAGFLLMIGIMWVM